MPERVEVVAAIEASWARDTSGTPDEWDASNPAKGHCDVASFVAWEYLGGELVLGQVHLAGEFQEHHYWNRVDGVDLDLTRSQFRAGEVISEKAILESEFLTGNQEALKPELKARLAAFRQVVGERLGHS